VGFDDGALYQNQRRFKEGPFFRNTENGRDFSFYREKMLPRKSADLHTLKKLNAFLETKKKDQSDPQKIKRC
jgi:hypothetical protein